MSRWPDGTDPVGELVENTGYTPGMVTGWFLFVQFIDPETGDTCYMGDTMEGQGSTTTLGFIAASDAIERQRIVNHHFNEDSDL